jgi:hypothetical protein
VSLISDIIEAVRELDLELTEHDTGRSVTVCLEKPIEMGNANIFGMSVSTIGPDQGFEVNTVHIGHGEDCFEVFQIPPAGLIEP